MHPLSHLIPLIVCTLAAVICWSAVIEDLRRQRSTGDMAILAAAASLATAATMVSITPAIAWWIGATP
jgi:hypothetical protein